MESTALQLGDNTLTIGDGQVLHTSENPYCGTLSCSRHTDWQYHAIVIAPSYNDRQLAAARAMFGMEEVMA